MKQRPAAVLVFLLAGAVLHGDEAVLRDGRKLTGLLKLDSARWLFQPANGDPIQADNLLTVHFASAPATPLHAAVPLRLLLRDGQHLTGGVNEIDGKSIILQTASMGKLSVPRTAAVGLRQPPGWALVHANDFEDEPGRWKLTGQPARRGPAASGEKGLVLDDAGQSAEFVLANPLPEGRASLSFHDSSPGAGRWQAEAEFQDEGKTRLVSVQLNGDKTYRAAAKGLEGETTPLPRSPGWHRLVVQFSPGSLRVAVDDSVLWHTLKRGPGGPLTRLRLCCEGKPVRGAVSFDDFSLHRACDEPRHPPGDAQQDEVWLHDGGQLFGQFLRAERQTLIFEGKFGRRVLPWTLVRGIYPKPSAAGARQRGQVRLWIDNGFDSQPDFLDGAVQSCDARRIVLHHPELGELSVERASVLRLSWPANDQR